MPPSKDEHVTQIQEHVTGLEELLPQLEQLADDKRLRNILFVYFVRRAIQIGHAAVRITDLDTPLTVLYRVLCEDFICLYWCSLSEQNVREYSSASRTQMEKVSMSNLNRLMKEMEEQGKPLNIDIEPFKLLAGTPFKKTIKEMADDSGLSPLYDWIYRNRSLELHAHGWALPSFVAERNIVNDLGGISALLKLVIAVLMRYDEVAQPVSTDEVVKAMGLVLPT